MSSRESRAIVRGSAQERSHSKELHPPNMGEVTPLRILLLGKSASESSLVGNSILGRSALDSEAPPDVVERVGGRVKDRHVTLINSPHLLQTDISEHQITQTLRECVSLSDPGPHVVVLVLNPPCSAGDGERLEQLRDSLSDGLFQHSLVISTREPTDTDEVLQEILQRCSHRHFSLQTSSSPEEILQMCEEIQRSNGGRHLQCVKKQDKGGGRLTSKTREEEFREREEQYKTQLKEKEEREEQMCVEMKREREEREKQKLEEKTRREEEDEKRREAEHKLKLERVRWERGKVYLQSKNEEEEENKMKILMEEMNREREEEIKKHEEVIERMQRMMAEERQNQEEQRKRREEEFREREERYKRVIKEREEKESKMLEDMKGGRIQWEKQKSELQKKQPVQETKSSVSEKTTASEGWWLTRRIPDSRGIPHTKASLSPRRIVLLGKSGVGKSASGNTILGQRAFESAMRMKSVTSVCSEAQAIVSGKSVSVVDTPGFFDPWMRPEESALEMARSPGPQAFLIVFRIYDRVTEHEQQIPQQIKLMFGQEVLKYSIILFTHGDLLEYQSVEEIIDEDSRLRHLVDQCGGRFHVFNNRDVNNRDQVNELLQKIDSMVQQNGGGHYSYRMYGDAHRFRQEEEVRRLREGRKQDENQGCVCS